MVTAPRKQPTQARSRATVAVILEAAARILAERGYAAATTNAVAKRAGVSIGSLYQYFPTREALVAAVAAEHAEAVKARVERRLAEAVGSSMAETARALLGAVIDAHAVNPALHRVLDEETPRLGPLDYRQDARRRSLAAARAFLDQHAAELRPGLDRDLTAFLIASAVDGVVGAAVAERPTALGDGTLINALTDMLTAFLSTPSRWPKLAEPPD